MPAKATKPGSHGQRHQSAHSGASWYRVGTFGPQSARLRFGWGRRMSCGPFRNAGTEGAAACPFSLGPGVGSVAISSGGLGTTAGGVWLSLGV